MYQSFSEITIGATGEHSQAQPTFAPALLTLPRIDKDVTVGYDSVDSPSIIMFARRLAEIGVITPDDMKCDRRLIDTIDQVLVREINFLTGPMRLADLDFTCLSQDKSMTFYEGADGFEEALSNCTQFVVFVIDIRNYRNQSTVLLKKAVSILNKVQPDLAETLYAVLERSALHGSIAIDTYSTILERFHYELDVDNEMWDEQEPGDRANPSPQVRLARLAKKFPFSWVANAICKLSPYEIFQLSQNSQTPKLVVDAIEAALDIAKHYELGQHVIGNLFGLTSVFSLGAIEFFEQDPTSQLKDDVLQFADSCSDYYSENLHEGIFDISSTETFKKQWDALSHGLRLLGAIERLYTAFDNLEKGAKK